MIRTRFGIILREPTPTDIAKKKWVQKYSHRLIRLWLRQQTPFGVARAYAEHIKECLTEFYEDPLKRTFIETNLSLAFVGYQREKTSTRGAFSFLPTSDTLRLEFGHCGRLKPAVFGGFSVASA